MEEVRYALSSEVKRPIAERKMVRTEVLEKEKKKENDQEDPKLEVICPRNLPIMQGDLGMFSVACMIGTRKFEHAILDLGLAINIMLASIYHDF